MEVALWRRRRQQSVGVRSQRHPHRLLHRLRQLSRQVRRPQQPSQWGEEDDALLQQVGGVWQQAGHLLGSLLFFTCLVWCDMV